MRSAEITLFLIPFALFAAWRISVAYARPSVVWASVAASLLLAVGLALYGVSRRVPPTDAYVPARIEAGKIVPGQGVPR
jgi:hypothetical protein